MEVVGFAARADNEIKTEVLVSQDWSTMYKSTPEGNKPLFELEALVAKRMELLAWIDQVVNSPTAKSFDAVLTDIGRRLPEERRNRSSGLLPKGRTSLGSERVDSQLGGKRDPFSSSLHVTFEKDEDLTSHLLCRFAFCMSERWRKWFVKTEEILLRARLKLEMEKDVTCGFLADIMKKNGLPCESIDASMKNDEVFKEYLEYRNNKDHAAERREVAENFYMVPMSLATRLIRNRSVLLRRGMAILYRDQVQEVFLTVFRGQINKGLHSAFLLRMKQQNMAEDSERQNVMHMLDAFLEHFIADPTDNLEEGEEGSVRAGDVNQLAKTHFPLCMRQIDTHIRREGHLKHHGRFTYGLFLKAIGLSLDDSMQLFSTLMTVKGGGSPEAFSKTAYGYNIRHNYGMEGKKTSYTSASCSTLLGLPPMVDQHDCHGCPFRFRDEARFRNFLQQSQNDPRGKGFGEVHPSMADIEDIIVDCKGQHYTRACFKYFKATHKGTRRDTLFRSPYEYFICSREHEHNHQTEEEHLAKKRQDAPPLNEAAVRMKKEIM